MYLLEVHVEVLEVARAAQHMGPDPTTEAIFLRTATKAMDCGQELGLSPELQAFGSVSTHGSMSMVVLAISKTCPLKQTWQVHCCHALEEQKLPGSLRQNPERRSSGRGWPPIAIGVPWGADRN